MPAYTYRCCECGHVVETRHGFDEAGPDTCPLCASALRKQFGTVAVTFRGSGFYRTDSRAAARKPAAR